MSSTPEPAVTKPPSRPGVTQVAATALVALAPIVSARLGPAGCPDSPDAWLAWPLFGVVTAALLAGGRLAALGALGALAAPLAGLAPTGEIVRALVPALAGAFVVDLLLRRGRRGVVLRALQDLPRLLAVGLLAGAPVASLVSLGIDLARSRSFASVPVGTGVAELLGNCAGFLVLACGVLAAEAPPRRGAARRPELPAFLPALLLATAAGVLAFGDGDGSSPSWSVAAVLAVPALVWPAHRFDLRGAAAANALLALFVLPAVALDAGPFAGHPAATRFEQAFAFLTVASTVNLFVSLATARSRQLVSELTRSEERFRTLVEASPAAIVEIRDGVVRFANPAAEEAFRSTPAAPLVGSPVAGLFEAAATDAVARILAAEETESAAPRQVEVDFRRLDGAKGRALVSVRPVPSPDGSSRLVAILDVSDRHELEKKRESQERKARALLEAGHELIVVLDPAGRILFRTDSTAQMLGIPPGEAEPPSFFGFLHPEDLLRFRSLFYDSLSQAAPLPPVVLRVPHPSGHWLHLEVVCSDLRSDPDVAGVILSGRDVSAREEAQRGNRETQKLLTRLAEASPDVLYVYDLERGRTVFLNRAFDIALGITTSSGEPLTLADLQGRSHPDDVRRYGANADRYESLRDGEVLETEYRLRHEDGSWVWFAERCAVLDRAEDGRPRRIVGVNRDVTVRRKTEELRRRLDERYRLVAERATDVLAVAAMDGTVTYVSPVSRSALGFEPEELVGKDLLQVVHPDDLPSVQSSLRGLSQPGQLVTYTCRLVRKDGTVGSFESSVTLLGEPGADEPQEIVGLCRDVSARSAQEEELLLLERRVQQTQKLESLGILAGGIAHDFNNLLVGILGNTSSLLADLPAESPLRPVAEEIETAGRRASDLTRQLLAYTGKTRFVARPIDVALLVREMQALLSSAISRNARIFHEADSPLPLIEGDPSQIRQVVMNLLTNASEALVGGAGRIRIRIRTAHVDQAFLQDALIKDGVAEGKHVLLEVADDGRGMDESIVSRIFDPFFTTKFTGRGLGLSAVLGIIRSHRGTIRVESAPGRGTTFQVLLPVRRSSHPAGDEVPPISTWRGRGTLLIIDDDDAVLAAVSRCVTALGLESRTASGGQEGLRILDEGKESFVAVLVDMTMPGISGDEVLSRVRQKWPDLPVVVMSGFAGPKRRRDAAARGMDWFLPKPFGVDELRHLLAEVVRPGPDRA